MKTHPPRRPGQSGIMLLEAMIAILIFSLGVLALVALQGTSIKLTGDAKYRTDATLLANRLIGQMWVRGGSLAQLKEDFQTDGDAYDAWRADVSAASGLPGVVAGGAGVVSTLPLVAVTLTPTSALVTITLYWRTPEMDTNAPGHRHIVATQIAKTP